MKALGSCRICACRSSKLEQVDMQILNRMSIVIEDKEVLADQASRSCQGIGSGQRQIRPFVGVGSRPDFEGQQTEETNVPGKCFRSRGGIVCSHLQPRRPNRPRPRDENKQRITCSFFLFPLAFSASAFLSSISPKETFDITPAHRTIKPDGGTRAR